jgi:hypothetical protein
MMVDSDLQALIDLENHRGALKKMYEKLKE